MASMNASRAGLLSMILPAATLSLACQDRQDPLSDLEDTKWVLVDVAGHRALPSPLATLEFTETGVFGGHTSCNSFGGRFEADRDRLQVTELMQNLAGCLSPIGDQESRYMDALSGAERIELEDDELLMHSDAFDLPLRFRPAGE